MLVLLPLNLRIFEHGLVGRFDGPRVGRGESGPFLGGLDWLLFGFLLAFDELWLSLRHLQ